MGLSTGGSARLVLVLVLVLVHWNTAGAGIGNASQVDEQRSRSTWAMGAARCDNVGRDSATDSFVLPCLRGMLDRMHRIAASINYRAYR